MNEEHPDKYLLQKFNQGAALKDQAFTELVKQYGPILYPQIQRLTRNKEWTNDCLQNVFLKVYEKIENFKGDSSIYSWLFRIAHNETLNFLAKEKLRTGVDLSDQVFEIKAGNSFLDQISSDQIQNLLSRAIDALPRKQAEIFELKYFQEKKYSEISALTGISEGGLKANYHHAVKKIEEFLIHNLNL